MKIRYYLLILIQLFTFNIKALELSQLNKIGKSRMSFLFLDIYDIELHSKNIIWQQNSFPQALKITYLRDIAKKDLIKATKEQWQHLQLNQAKQDIWLKQLNTIWPEIKKGNGLTIIVDSDQKSRFFFSSKEVTNQLIGEITDPNFGPAFLAIWLSKNTSEPKMRSRLIGN